MAKTELYNKYRPQTFDEVVGQDKAVKTLRAYIDEEGHPPNALLFTGPSGTGKTTLARILARQLGFEDVDDIGCSEINCAVVEPMNTVKDIEAKSKSPPLFGDTIVWILDEFQSLSRATGAQQALLKVIEDGKSFVYFFLCTTDHNKILPTVKNRCTMIPLIPVKYAMIATLVKEVTKAERRKIADSVPTAIADLSEGSPRRALKLLDQVMRLPIGEQLKALENQNLEKKAIEICRMLYRGAAWRDLAAVVKEVDEDPEGLRRMILGYSQTILLSGGPLAPKAAFVIEAFRDNFFDCGKAGLAACCYHCTPKNRR